MNTKNNPPKIHHSQKAIVLYDLAGAPTLLFGLGVPLVIIIAVLLAVLVAVLLIVSVHIKNKKKKAKSGNPVDHEQPKP